MFANIRLIVLSSILLLTGAFAYAGDVEPEVQAQVQSTLETLLDKDNSGMILRGVDLDRDALDYSLNSLKTLDAWLQQVYLLNRNEVEDGKAGATLTTDGRGKNTLILAGLYMGETVRRSSEKDWYWVPYTDFVVANPVFADAFGEAPELDSVILVTEKDNAIGMPINSALKRVINGPIDSVEYVGNFLALPLDMEKAMEGYEPAPVDTIKLATAADVEDVTVVEVAAE